MKKGIKPDEVAELFYKLLVEGKYDQWLKTFRKYHREQAERHGSSPDLYWRAGRKMQDKYGYTYHRVKEKDQKISDTHWKLWFQRKKPDGLKSGSPAPIHIVRDKESGGEWRVDIATV